MERWQLAIEACGIHKHFADKNSARKVHALDDLSLQAPIGALTALVGPDGAGKTTFLRLVAGLMPWQQGSLRVLGLDVATSPQAVQDRISYMPQRFGLYEDLSVQENLDLYADLHGVSHEQRATRYARLLEMTDLRRFVDRLAGKLSGGMKQKLGLACALVHSPQLLLLDEPTVGVDPLSRRELWEIVQQLMKESELSVLLSTTYMDEAQRCDHVHVLHEGVSLATGKPEDIAKIAENACFVVTSPDKVATRLLQARLLDDKATIIDAVPVGAEVRVICRAQKQADIETILAGCTVRPAKARLEDGFMVLLDRQLNKDSTPGATQKPPITRRSDAKPSHEPIIEVRDLMRRFGDFVAVERSTFTIQRGEIFGLLGPNGAGKTTTFRMLCGLLPASSGHARVAGMDLRSARAQARQRIGYVSQKFALYGWLTCLENLSFLGKAYGLYGRRLQTRLQEIVQQFGLEAYARTGADLLPGGVKQRLAMASALLHEPEIVFLDEPTSGVDPLTRRAFWRRITDLAQNGTTIVITTHFMEEAEYCDRLIIQDAGKLLAIGTPGEVRAQGGESAAMPLDMEQAFIRIVEQARHGREAA